MRLALALLLVLSGFAAPASIVSKAQNNARASSLDSPDATVHGADTPAANAANATTQGGSSPGIVAFVDVNVVPMDRERILSGQTVIVRGDRIAALGPKASTPVPDAATRIDGRGKYLMPGLTEMHAHLTGANDALNRRILLLNVRHGVTTVRGMLGHPSHLVLRERVAKGELIGPTIYTSGPSVNGKSVPTPEAAVTTVREQKAAGYDFLKIHPGVSRAAFDALAAEADKQGIRFAGHVPADVGLTRALEARYATIDHIDGYVEALTAEKAGGRPVGLFGFLVADAIDTSRIPALVEATKKAGVAIVPTETVLHSFIDTEPPADTAKRDEMRAMPEGMIGSWVKAKTEFAGTHGFGTPETRETFFGTRRALIRAFHASGVKLLLGADSPQVFAVPGYAAHHELRWMVAAGLTPYQALETGTRNVAEFFGTSKDRGTLAANKRADAVLVDGNPLQDVANASRISGVLLNGRWMTTADLDKELAAVAVP